MAEKGADAGYSTNLTTLRDGYPIPRSGYNRSIGGPGWMFALTGACGLQVTPGPNFDTFRKLGRKLRIVVGFAAYNCLYVRPNSEVHIEWKYGEAEFYIDKFDDFPPFDFTL